MNDTKKFHIWLKGMLQWQAEEPAKANKKSRRAKRSSNRYYVGEAYPGVYLTTREFEIATLLVKDYRYKEIAKSLILSPRSVEFYVQHLREKFQCGNKKALVNVLKKITIE